MATLKLTPNYLNNYEMAYDVLSKSSPAWLFYQEDWELAANKGNLDMYITAMQRKDELDLDKLNSSYNYQFSDSSTRTSAIYNELFANRENTDTERTRLKLNENGEPTLDNKGLPVYETFKASDYEYSKQVIKSINDENYNKYLIQQEQERKDSMSGFGKFMSTVVALPAELVSGVANTVDNLVNTVISTGQGLQSMSKGLGFSKGYVESSASDAGRLFENMGLQDAIADFESRYSYMRDIDGNYSGFGKYAGGALTSIGEMLPAMVAGYGAGAIAKGAGAAASTISKVGQATSTLVFYQSATNANIRQMYNEMAANNASVSTEAIMWNAYLKSAAQYGVEMLLAKFAGGTAFDNLVFGRSVSSSAVGGNLTSAGLFRVWKDFHQEGMEEVLQEFSDFFVDKAFSVLVNENFGKNTNLTWQTLTDCYLIGGLASFAGNAKSVLTTKRITTNMAAVNKDGTPKLDKQGKPVASKLGKLASWEYGLNLKSFMENFNTLQEDLSSEQDIDWSSKEGQVYKTAYLEMYASYRMMASIYANIGEERFKNANELLTEIDNLIREGKFSNDNMLSLSTQLANKLHTYSTATVQENAQKLADADMTQITDVVQRDSDLSDYDAETQKQIKNLFDSDKNITKVTIAKDGSTIAILDDDKGENIAVPENYLKNGGSTSVLNTDAEQTLVKAILQGKFKGKVLDTVLEAYKQVYGDENAQMDVAVYHLLFEPSFFRIVLASANKDMYAFLTSLSDMERSVVPSNLRKKVYKQKIAKAKANMLVALYDYCVNNVNARFEDVGFTKDMENKIRFERWSKDLYHRVIEQKSFEKLTQADWTVLTNRINSLPIIQSEKDSLLNQLKTGSIIARTAAMNRISKHYNNIFNSKYDGETYMPDTTTPNRTINAWMQSEGLTIKTLGEVDEKLKKTVDEDYAGDVMAFRKSQFSLYCNDKYTFDFDKGGKLGVFENGTHQQVGFALYNESSAEVVKHTDLDNKTVIETAGKKSFLLQEILNENLDAATAAYVSIDDVITNPSLLSPKIQARITATYGTIDIESTFMFLRDYFIGKTGNTSVTVLPDGSYRFVNIRAMTSSLKSPDGDFKINSKTTISQLIDAKHLYGRLKGIKIKLVDANIIAEYNMLENAIYINKSLAEKGGDYLKFAFLHEFQHAIQAENRMNLGINENWLANVAKTTRAEIIRDVRKHRPELFEGVKKGSDTEAKIVNNFVYFSTGESAAMGIDATKMLDFYPTIVKYDENRGTKILFPWGASYSISNKIPFSFTNPGSMFDIKFDERENTFYKSEAKELIKHARTMYKIDANHPRNYKNMLPSIHNDGIEAQKYMYNRLLRLSFNKSQRFLINTLSKIESLQDINDIYTLIDLTISVNKFDAIEKTEAFKTYLEFSGKTYDVNDSKSIRNIISNFQKYYVAIVDKRYNDLRSFDLMEKDKLGTVTIKRFTVKEIKAFYEKYHANIELPPEVITLFTELEKIDEDFPLSIVAINEESYFKEFYSNKKRDGNTISGYSIVDVVRFAPEVFGTSYNSRGGLKYSNKREYLISVIVHEFVHTLTSPLLDVQNSKDAYSYLSNKTIKLINTWHNFYDYVKSMFAKYYAPRKYYAFENSYEFLSERFDREFMLELERLDSLIKPEKHFIQQVESATGIHCETFYDLYITMWNYLITRYDSEKSAYIEYFNTNLRQAGRIDSFLLDDYYRVKSELNKSEPKELTLKQGEFVINPFTKTKLYGDGTTEVAKPGDYSKAYNYDNYATSLGKPGGMSLMSPEQATIVKPEGEESLSRRETEIENNKKRVQFKRPGDENTYYRDENDDKYFYDEKGNKLYLDDSGKIKKAFVKDVASGSFVPKQNKRRTNTRTVSQKEAKGTNLEKYGWVGPYSRTQMEPDFRDFIVGANDKIAPELWKKVKNGTLTSEEVLEYLFTASEMNQETFDLINDSYFRNEHIKTFEELLSLADSAAIYYAARAAVKYGEKGKYRSLLTADVTGDNLKQMLTMIAGIPSLQKIFERAATNFDTKNGQTLNLNTYMIKRLFMEQFDGTLESAGYPGGNAKYIEYNGLASKGKIKDSKKLEDRSGKDDSMEFGDQFADETSMDGFNRVTSETPRLEKVLKLKAALKFAYVITSVKNNKNKSAEFISKVERLFDKDSKVLTLLSKAVQKDVYGEDYVMPEEKLDALLEQALSKLTPEQRDKAYLRYYIPVTQGKNVMDMKEKEAQEAKELADRIAAKMKRGPRASVENSKRLAREIRKNLPEVDTKRFLAENSKYFNKDLTLKQELYGGYIKSSKGNPLFRISTDLKALEKLEEDLREVLQKVRMHAYGSVVQKRKVDKLIADNKRMKEEFEANLLNQFRNKERKQSTQKEQSENKEQVSKRKYKTFNVADDVITVDTGKEMPTVLARFLEKSFTAVSKTNVKYLSGEDDYHIKMDFDSFVKDNAELLAVLTTEDARQILEFYEGGEIIPSTNKARQYGATQIYLLTYIISKTRLGDLDLTAEEIERCRKRLESLSSIPAAMLNAWRNASQWLDPTKAMIQSLKKSLDIEFSAEDEEELSNAISSGNIERIRKAKERMYEHGVASYKGRPQDIFDRLFKFEQLMMLSGPGTWVRNQVSNVIVTGGNIASDFLGEGFTKMLSKLFPKTFKKSEKDLKQYKMSGTKVTAEVSKFIKEFVIDTKLLELLGTSLTKYDGRKHKDGSSMQDTLADLITNGLKSSIRYGRTSNSKIINDTFDFVYKRLSDDPYIKKATIKYLGKMLAEDEVDLSQGLSTDVLNRIADAYVFASQDYMHTGNFWHDIEAKLRERLGPKGMFIYKQFLPFAATSWNWFVEGLRYTPIGLVNSIIKFAKLEKTIETIETKRQKGYKVTSERFAEYLTKRNIGKGVIGTIGFVIGALLAAFGAAGIDEEDGKYKLYVGDVYVDISEVFSTQGIMLGMVAISCMKDKDTNFWSAAGTVLDTMFMDSAFTNLFNSFRYSETFGEWLRDQPFEILTMFVPNFLKTISSLTNQYKIEYSKGVLGKFEKLVVQSIPGIAYAFPKKIDPYTGENQIMYKANFLVQFINKLSPINIHPYNVSENEKIALSVGVKKDSLRGNYEINGERVKLTSKELQQLNEFYGKLNKKELTDFVNNKKAYKIWSDKEGKYVELYYKQMTKQEKATIFDRVMSNNSSLAKIYILTETGKYKYYVSESEYADLKALGIKASLKTDKKDGFVKTK